MSPKKDKTKNKQLLCVGSLALVLVVSMLGFAAMDETEEIPIQQVQVSLYFGDSMEVVSEVINVTEGQKAQDAFNQIGNVVLDLDSMGGLEVSSVSAGNYSATANETHTWVFYINGVLRLDKYVDSYVINPETDAFLELRFEEKPY